MVSSFGLRTTLAAALAAGAAAAHPCGPSSPWNLVWSDEFNARAESPPDPANWTFDIGGNGWGNRELQQYTDRVPLNAVVSDGSLAIRALRETYTGPDGVTRAFTSARLKTLGHVSALYGRIEARIKVPSGRGLWPAFWMLGEDIKTAGWPECGEIDILEARGREPSIVHGTIHGPGYAGSKGITASYTLPGLKRLADDFHVFAVEWESHAIHFYVDGNLYKTTTPSNLPAGSRWVFDHPFFVILNVAVGGEWSGDPDTSTAFPQTMLVDYVRIFRRTAGQE
jgi:beta-glucanase (GH16 family)